MTKIRVARSKKIHVGITSSLLLVFLFLLNSCSNFTFLSSNIKNTEFQLAEVLFKANLPAEIPSDARVMLEIVDDVTGVYFNATRYEMVRDNATQFSLRIPLKVSTEVKYRYVRVTDTTAEYEKGADGRLVRFRIARVERAQIFDDIVASWTDGNPEHPSGRIAGQVIDQATNAPIPNLLISVGGSQMITSSDGSFTVDDLPPGVHNLVMYSMDGAYKTFQQGALVATDATTPVLVYLERRPTTRVRFEVTLPRDHPKDIPLKFVSNLSQLGNAYADLASGSASSAVNNPTMTQVTNNRYYIELDLPVGLHLRYKYSYGDGFWNAELTDTGNFITRDLVVREEQDIQDRVVSFSVPNFAPIKISVKVPDSTPPQEKVYIQFKPFEWTEPLPMVHRGSGIWEYTVYSPMQFSEALEYRFCRNGQCGIAAGETNDTTTITAFSETQSITNTIVVWENLTETTIDSSEYLAFAEINIRPDFIAGVEFSPAYVPGWRAIITPGLNFSQQLGGDYVILSPTWSTSGTDSPSLSIAPGKDLMWYELMTMINHVTISGQLTILYPQINYTQDATNYYSSDRWSEEYKNSWYDQYQRFLYHNADLAQIMEVDGLVISEPAIPYLEQEQLSIDKNAVKRELDNVQWNSIISGLRDRYDGNLIGVVSISANNTYSPTWLDQVDMVYVLLSPAIDLNEGSVEELKEYFDKVLDSRVKPLISDIEKPVLIGISYPSSEQAKFGLPNSNPYQQIAPEVETSNPIDMELQAKIYSAIVQSSASREWVQGFFSRGYYPYVELQDSSSSIFRKPASDVLWFWFHFLLNKTP